MSGAIGKVKGYRVVIDNYDVTDATIGCKIFHDMQSTSWSAQVFFMDTNDLLVSLPITSGSKIKIMLETKHNVPTDMKKEFEFVIYRIGDKSMQGQQTLMYTAFAGSADFVKNLSTRISRNFKNKKMTDCIRSVINDTFPNMKVDGIPCDNNASLIIPNWTPYNSVGWMLKMAHVNSRADFLMFQTEQDTYTVDSILNCFTKSAGDITLKVRPSNIKDIPDPEDVYNIFKHEIHRADASINMSSGYYGNTLKTFDFRTKKWDVKEYKTSEKKNWSGDEFDNSTQSVVKFRPKAQGVNGDNISPSDDAEIWVQSRMASLLNLEQEKLIACIPGTVGCYAWLGKTINVDLPNQVVMINNPKNVKQSGRYLVTSVVHNYDRQTYTNTIELVRRSTEP